jgi:hypothetical protein
MPLKGGFMAVIDLFKKKKVVIKQDKPTYVIGKKFNRLVIKPTVKK